MARPAADKLKGITIEIDGNVQPLTAAIKKATAASEGLSSELNSINRLLKNVDPGNIDLLKQKQAVLNTTIDSTKKKLELLETAFANANPKEVGEAQYRELERQIISTKDKLSSYESQLRETEDAISKVEKETGEAAEETKDFGEQAKKSGEETKKLSATSKVAFAAVGAAIAGAASKLGSFLVDSVEASKELRGDLSKLEQNAKSAGMSLEDVSGSLEYLVGITDETDSSVEALSNLMAAGFKGQGLADAVETLSGAVLKFPDTIKIESLADSLQETLATGAATGQFAEVLDRCGVSADDFSAELAKCTTQAEKQELALKTLSNAGLKKISQDYKAANADMLEYSAAQLRYEKSVANLGKAMQPAMTAWKNATAELNDALADVAQSADFERLIKKVSSALDSLVKKVLPGLIDALIFVVDNGDTVLTIIASIGAGMAGWKVGQWASTLISSFKALIAGIQGADAAQKGLNATMAANPIGLVLSAVAALIPLLASWSQGTIQISEETQRLVDESKELAETTKETAATYEETTAKIESQAKVANDYVDQMEEIKKSSLSAEDKQRKLSIIAGKLTSQYPELADEVDKYTDNTNASADALRDAISASKEYYKQEAQAKRLKEVMEEAATAEQKAAEALIKLNDVTTQYNEKEEEMSQYVANNSDFLNENSEYANQLEDDLARLSKEKKAAGEAYKTFSEEAQNANDTLETVKKTVEENIASTEMLTDAEAEYLILKQEMGKKLNNEELKQLEAYKVTNAATYDEIKESTEEQRALLEERMGIVRNAFERIKQDTALSYQQIVDNLRGNTADMEQFTKDLATLVEGGLDQGLIAVLEEKGPEAAAQVRVLVEEMKSETFDGFKEVNEAWYESGQAVLKSGNAGFKSGNPTEGIDYVLDENATAARQDTSVSGELVDLIAYSKGEMTKAVSRQGFDSVGSSIVAHVAKGITDASQKVYNAVNAMVSGIKKRINVNISTSSSGSSVRVKGFASGGILSREQIIRVAERGPEAVVPLDRLGGIVEGAMRRVAASPQMGSAAPGGQTASISVTVGTFINNTDADMEKLTTRMAQSLQEKINRRNQIWNT